MTDEENSFAVAVVGMACRFPGANDSTQFWENLRAGVESISFFTDEDMLADGVEPERLKLPNLVRAGGLLAGVELFDASFFGYSPREAELLDPQQRLFLECAWEALEHSGYDPEAYPGAVGVYAGTSMSGYLLNIFSDPDLVRSADPLQLALGNDKDYLATRVAYKLNLQGPAVTVQSSCSTSLVAVHMACQSLLAGECEMALAGGVTIFLPQKNGFIYQEGGIVAPDGHTRAFDAEAQGCIGGSGVGIVVLKRLEDALADGDTIHSVIKGSAVNNDGSLKVGYTAPSVEGQARVIRAAQALAGVSPETITYVEAHGTATPLGDPIEVAALKQAFRAARGDVRHCALGSVKTNVGHLDAAAGVAGLIKTVLALKHREIPPSLHFARPNPQIDFADSPFFVNAVLSEWKTGGAPRRAGVSSFGIGGTNAHLILEEAPEPAPHAPSRDCQLLLLSAQTEDALEAATAGLSDHLARCDDAPLSDMAYTLQVGRRAFIRRRAILCHSVAEAAEVLERRDPARLLDGGAASPPRPVVFLFPGQGSQHVGMGAGLYRDEPIFRDQVDECADLLRPLLGLDIREVLYPADSATEEAALRLRQTILTQTSLFVFEYALAKLWAAWGLRPAAMLGHSLGEYVVACLAGVFPLEDALRLVAIRARLIQQLPAGSMLAVPLAEREVKALLQGTSLSLAAVNGTEMAVVSGPRAEVERLRQQLDARGLVCRELHTSHAFHSEMMRPAAESFTEALAGLGLRAPVVPYVSNLTGDWVTAEQATDPRYWAAHMLNPVRFGDGLKTILDGPEGATLLEVGPGETLSSLARRHPSKGEGHTILSSLGGPHDRQSEDIFLLRTLARLWLEGQRVDWARLHEHQRRRVPLPTYPFQRRRYWIERRQTGAAGELRQGRSSPRRRELADWFYAPVWKQSLLPAEYLAALVLPPSRWLIFVDECGVGSLLAERLWADGHQAVTVGRGADFLKTDERAYVIDPCDPTHYDRLLGELRAHDASPQRIVHLWSVTHGDETRSGSADADEMTNLGFYSLLFLAQAVGERLLGDALAQDGSIEPLRLAIISNDMQQVLRDESNVAEKATLLGPCRVIPQEYPHVVCRSIDLTLGAVAGPEMADMLLAELMSERTEQVLAYRGRQRWVQDYEPLRLPEAAHTPARLREGGVYLITGGLGGLGLEIAGYLARTVRARLVLLNRTTFPARAEWDEWHASHDEEDAIGQKIRRLLALEAAGAEVLVLSADVTDEAQTAAAFREASRRFGEINGVIHAAGLGPSGLIQRKTREMASAVLAPKVGATRTLDALARSVQADFLLLCSSLRALTGGCGMLDYCAANAFLDAFARGRPRDVTTTISINWDGWAQAGMSLKVGAEAAEAAERDGEGMTNEEGIIAFGRALRVSLPQLIVSTRDLPAVLEQEQSPAAADFLERLREKPARAAAAHPRPPLRDAYVAPRNEVERALAEIWRESLGLAEVGVNDNFFELGGDSIISLRIIAKANQANIRLSPRQVFEHQTIAEQGPITGPAPLTPVQHWFFEENPSGPHHFNQAVLLETRRRLDYDLLDRAVLALVRHHDALRSRFTYSDSSWRQFLTAPDEMSVCLRLDLSGLPASEQLAAVEAGAAEVQTSLSLSDGPLLRVALFDLGPDRPGRLLFVVHHLVVDAVSWRILLEDLETAYNQLAAGGPAILPPKTTSYKQWGKRLLQYADSGAAENELDLWLEEPRRMAPALPADFPGAVNTVSSLRTISASLDAEATTALLHRIPQGYLTQINDALLTALVKAVARWTGRHALLLDLEGHGRDPDVSDVDLSRTVGWFSAIHPVLLDTEGARDYGEALRIVKEQLRRVRQGGIGYGVLRYLGPAEVRNALRDSPQSGLSFLYLGQTDQTLSGQTAFGPAVEDAGPVRDRAALRRYALEVVAGVTGGRLLVNWTYSENLHRASTIEALAANFTDALRALIAHCQATEKLEFTPSDFADFRWSREQLADIISNIEKSTEAD